MKRAIILAVFLSGVAVAQTGKFSLTTPSGNWDLSQLSGYLFQRKANEDVTFKATGKPAKAIFNKGEREVTAPEIDGLAVRKSGKLELRQMNLRGGVKGQLIKGASTLNFSSQTAILQASGGQNRVDMEGGVLVTQVDRAAGSKVVVTGRKGYVIQTSQGGRGKGELTGPVTIVLDGKSKTGDPVHFDAKGDRLDFDLSNVPYRVHLVGNVVLKGNDPLYQTESKVAEVTILLNEKNEPIEVQASGEPGETSMQPSRKP